MNEGDEILIRLVSGSSRAWLSLQGTILSYRGQAWGRGEEVDVPLELITVSGGKRLIGTRLIGSLLALLIGPGLGGAASGIWFLIRGDLSETALAVCMTSGFLLGVVAFGVLLVRFFVRQPTVILTIGDGNVHLEFWAARNDGSVLAQLLDEVQRRSTEMNDGRVVPVRKAVADVTEQPWKRTAALTWLCAVPGIMTENPWLLLFCILPLSWHGYRMVDSLKHPKAYRRAMRSYLRREWDSARLHLEGLLQTNPECLPASLMYVDLLCREGRFGDSESVLSRVQGSIDSQTLHVIQEGLVLRQRIWDRKQVH